MVMKKNLERTYSRCFISAPYGIDLGALPILLGERQIAWNWSEDTPVAEHASKAAERISKRSVKEIEQDIEGIANRYAEARDDLEAMLSEHSDIAFCGELPAINSVDGRERLTAIAKHFADSKSEALTEARTILGEGFNPEEKSAPLIRAFSGAVGRCGRAEKSERPSWTSEP